MIHSRDAHALANSILGIMSPVVLITLAVELFKRRGNGTALSNLVGLWPVGLLLGFYLACSKVIPGWAWVPFAGGLLLYYFKNMFAKPDVK
jgi:hypothetical protein